MLPRQESDAIFWADIYFIWTLLLFGFGKVYLVNLAGITNEIE